MRVARVMLGSLAVLTLVSVAECHRKPAPIPFQGVIRLGPERSSFQPCDVSEQWWLDLRASRGWTMPGGQQVEATLDAQPKCDVRIPLCEPQVAYVVLDGQLGPDRYHIGESYDRSIEITRVYSAWRFVPATCNQKRPLAEASINGQVIDWRPLQLHAAECPVHRVRLSETIVPVHFGKGAEDEGMLDESVGLPFAVDFVAGGCASDGEPIFARVLFCERCRQEKRSRGR